MTDGKPHPVAARILCILLLAYMGTRTCAYAANEASPQSQFSVEAKRSGDAVQVSVRTTVKAPLNLIWSTLTDYDHLAQFIPGMKRSRVIERQGKVAVIE